MSEFDDIRAIRKALGMTLGQFADVAGVSERTVRNWETGRTKPTPDILARVQALRGDRDSLQLLIFRVLADHTSDMNWIDEVGAKLEDALRQSGRLREDV